MPGENENPERLGKKALDRITELERIADALVRGMVKIEAELEEPVMPIGDYCGHKFED